MSNLRTTKLNGFIERKKDFFRTLPSYSTTVQKNVLFGLELVCKILISVQLYQSHPQTGFYSRVMLVFNRVTGFVFLIGAANIAYKRWLEPLSKVMDW